MSDHAHQAPLHWGLTSTVESLHRNGVYTICGDRLAMEILRAARAAAGNSMNAAQILARHRTVVDIQGWGLAREGKGK